MDGLKVIPMGHLPYHPNSLPTLWGEASSSMISMQSTQLDKEKLAEREICRRIFDIYRKGEKRKKFDNE